MSKVYGRCKRDLDDAAFSRSGTGRLQGYCREWFAAYQRERKYGGDAELLASLSGPGECPICGVVGPRVIDHDHDTGFVRDGTCSRCNVGMGQFEDRPELLRAAAEYLESHDHLQRKPYTLADDDWPDEDEAPDDE